MLFYVFSVVALLIADVGNALRCYNGPNGNSREIRDDAALSGERLCMMMLQHYGTSREWLFAYGPARGAGRGSNRTTCYQHHRDTGDIVCQCGTDLCNAQMPVDYLSKANDKVQCKSSLVAGGTCVTSGACVKFRHGFSPEYAAEKGYGDVLYHCMDEAIADSGCFDYNPAAVRRICVCRTPMCEPDNP